MIPFELRVGAWILRQTCRLRGHRWEMHGREFAIVGNPARGWPPVYICTRCGCEGKATPARTPQGPGVKIRPI